MSGLPETVVLLGASENPGRYSHKALRALLAHGHRVIPVNPNLKTIEGIPVVAKLAAVQGPVDTMTLYVNPQILESLIPEVIALRPKRIIANPGTETATMATAAKEAGIRYVEACTLVMLATGQF